MDVIIDDIPLEEFNPSIEKVFNCNTELDVCIDTENDCAIYEAKSCETLFDEEVGYYQNFVDVLEAINFGQVSYYFYMRYVVHIYSI